MFKTTANGPAVASVLVFLLLAAIATPRLHEGACRGRQAARACATGCGTQCVTLMDFRVAPQAESDLDEIWYFLATQSSNIDVAVRVAAAAGCSSECAAILSLLDDCKRLTSLIWWTSNAPRTTFRSRRDVGSKCSRHVLCHVRSTWLLHGHHPYLLTATVTSCDEYSPPSCASARMT